MTEPRIRNVLGLGAALVATLGAARARAEDETLALSQLLDESMVTGASKTQEASSDAPAAVTTITGEDLKVYGIRTLDEAVQYLARGMNVERNQLGFAQYAARGVNFPTDWGSHVLLVIDGHTVNESSLGVMYVDKTTGIPIEAIDHIEVIVGPGSVLYGTNAMLGTISVVTKSAASVRGLAMHAEMGGASSNDRSGALAGPLSSWGYQVRFSGVFGHTFAMGGKRAELTVFAQYLEDRVAVFPVGPQYGASNPAASGLDYGPNPATVGANGVPARYVWGGNFNQKQLSIPGLYARFSWGNLEVSARFDRWHHSQNETNPGYSQFNQPDGGGVEGPADVDIAYRFDVSERLQLRPRLYADHFLYVDTNRYFTNFVCVSATGAPIDTPCSQTTPSESWRYGAELTGSFDWFNDGRLSTLAGVDARLVNVFGKTDTKVEATGAQGGTVGIYRESMEPTFALFAQQIATVAPWLRLNAGLRFDLFASAPGLSQASTASPKVDAPMYQHVSPRGAVIVTPWRDGTLKFVFSEGFRRPSPYEIGGAVPGFQVAAPNLTSETVESLEMILEQRVQTNRFSLSLFRSWWRDMIGLVTLSSGPNVGLSQYQNVGAIDSYGLDASYRTTIGRFSGGVNTSVVSSNQLVDPNGLVAQGLGQAATMFGNNQPVPAAPRISGNAHGAYAFGEGLPTVALAASVLGPRIATNALTNPNMLALPSVPYAPTSLSMRLTLSGEFPWISHLRYRVAGEVVTPTVNPYSVGPFGVSQGANGTASADLQQVSRFTVMSGLDYQIF